MPAIKKKTPTKVKKHHGTTPNSEIYVMVIPKISCWSLYIFLFFHLLFPALFKQQITQATEQENLCSNLAYLGQGTEYIFGTLSRNLGLHRLRE